MKLKLLVGMQGPAVSRHKGDVCEIEEAEALRLIAAGYAVPFQPPVDVAPIHSTSLAQPEAAVLPSAKPRRLRGVS